MNDPIVAYGMSNACDFEANTWTFDMINPYQVSAGKYAILKESEYLKLLDLAKKGDHKL